MINKKIWVECEECGSKDNLSIHHVKNIYGIKTGEIQSLCRPCHDLIELEYEKNGIFGKHRRKIALQKFGEVI